LSEYWRICSWQKGQPNDRVSTTSDTPSVAIRLDTEMAEPSRRNTVDLERASRVLMFRAASEGAPEIRMVSALLLPLSHSQLDDDDDDEAWIRDCC